MMKYKRLFSLCILMLTAMALHAQDSRVKVELLTIDGPKAIFSSEGYGSDKKDAIANAQIEVLKKVLYEGVMDFNGSYPIVKSGRDTNAWLRRFFNEDGRNTVYKAFLGEVELVGDFDTSPSGETHCHSNVVVFHQRLLKDAENQGVTKSEGAQVPVKPTAGNRKAPKRTSKTFTD
jgi:hypothetical protein